MYDHNMRTCSGPKHRFEVKGVWLGWYVFTCRLCRYKILVNRSIFGNTRY